MFRKSGREMKSLSQKKTGRQDTGSGQAVDDSCKCPGLTCYHRPLQTDKIRAGRAEIEWATRAGSCPAIGPAIYQAALLMQTETQRHDDRDYFIAIFLKDGRGRVKWSSGLSETDARRGSIIEGGIASTLQATAILYTFCIGAERRLRWRARQDWNRNLVVYNICPSSSYRRSSVLVLRLIFFVKNILLGLKSHGRR